MFQINGDLDLRIFFNFVPIFWISSSFVYLHNAYTRSVHNDLVDQFKNRAEQKITERGQETCKLYTNSLYKYILYKYILYTYIAYKLYILKHILDREGVENKYVNYLLGEHPTPNPTLLLRHNKVIIVPVPVC